MPLDFGAVTEISRGAVDGPAESMGDQQPAAAAPAATIGAMLRAAREFRGLSLQDLADATRIRRAYLAALEEMRLDQLPSRPFAIGYVRACATVLGLDVEAAVARFKQDTPVASEALRAPVGVSHERDPRLSLAAGGVAVVLTAVLVWNLAQHAMASDAAPSPVAPEVVAARATPAITSQGPIVLSASQPAPRESEAPDPYVTPGLAPLAAAVDGAEVASAEPAPALARPAYLPKGVAYGAAPDQSAVTLQARKPASLIIRGADGAVYFARQLAAGESYRAPLMMKGLTVDVSDPTAFDVYANGAFKGALEAPKVALAHLIG